MTQPPTDSEIGSIDEYVATGAPIAAPSRLSFDVDSIGIHVFNAAGTLTSGQEMKGVGVSALDPSGPAYDAGIRSPRVRKLHASAEIGLAVLALGGAVFFPPAIMVIPLLDSGGVPKDYDVIVAVDAQRTRDVFDLEKTLQDSKAGELLYLTIIRDGHREQLRVPVVADYQSTPGSPSTTGAVKSWNQLP